MSETQIPKMDNTETGGYFEVAMHAQMETLYSVLDVCEIFTAFVCSIGVSMADHGFSRVMLWI